MVWLWLLLPLLVLAGAVALRWSTERLNDERRALQAEVDTLAPLGEAARSVRGAGGRLGATGRGQVHR